MPLNKKNQTIYVFTNASVRAGCGTRSILSGV